MQHLNLLDVVDDDDCPAQGSNRGSPHAALRYAAHAYAALDRRMDEAEALTKWLARSARALGLTEAQAPSDEQLAQPARFGVAAETWREVGRSLAAAARRASVGEAVEADLWVAAAAGALALDPLDADILSLAVHYGLDRRVEDLFDALSGAQQGRPACIWTPTCSLCCSGHLSTRCRRGWPRRRGCARAGCSAWTARTTCGCCPA